MKRSRWEDQPDGSRVKVSNGIRIVDRTRRRPTVRPIEHLVTWQEDGQTIILGLDRDCRPVYRTALERRS